MRSLIISSCALIAALPVMAGPPQTRKSPTTDTYHGVSVSDDYRWLEDWADPRVREWSDAQNAYARSVLDGLPGVEDIRARLTELEKSVSAEHMHIVPIEGGLLAMKNQPPKQQAMLVWLASADDLTTERMVVDPNQIDSSGSTTIDWFVPSDDGKLVAVSLSEGGSESGTVHVFDTQTGKKLGENDVIPRAHGGTAGGSLVWAHDGSGFYYTRYPRTGERPPQDMDFYVQVYFHKLGTPTAEDTYVIGKDFVRIAEVVLETDPTGRWLLVSVQNGDGGEFEHHLRNPKGAWSKLDGFADKVVEANFGEKALFLVSRDGAPRGKVLRLDLTTDDAMLTARDAREIIPEWTGSIATDFFANAGLTAGSSRLLVLYQAGGPNQLRMFDLDGELVGDVPLPPVSAVNEIVRTRGDDMLIATETFITPPQWMSFDASSNALRRTRLFQTSPVDFSDCEVVRELATSKDGTKVPISIIRHKGMGGALDPAAGGKDKSPVSGQPGKSGTPGWSLPAPTILWGYGGYGLNQSPAFSPRRAIWLEQGGVFAVANIRGGGEFGEEWHRSGNLTKKQNVFDDFQAAARHLIERGYTSHEKLAIMGGSNGGLLMGATFTQQPQLAKAVVSSVGIYDMLRVELSPNGAFNVTEFGTVKDPAQFRALHAYSPFHHVKDGVDYPAVLMLTGANDPRVDPMHSRKMIARLQAADPEGTFLLRTSANAGHGIGSSLQERIEQNVDIYSFLFHELGVEYTPRAAR
ncbi:MAG: prolyl oligopeptidase family serine peptidase [Phycisphaerales bacterium]|nr:prolyl oligopeptidase family serine peptidase [Phycisphaerales bacterium]